MTIRGKIGKGPKVEDLSPRKIIKVDGWRTSEELRYLLPPSNKNVGTKDKPIVWVLIGGVKVPTAPMPDYPTDTWQKLSDLTLRLFNDWQTSHPTRSMASLGRWVDQDSMTHRRFLEEAKRSLML